MNIKQMQALPVFSLLIAIISFGSLAYIYVAQPDYLKVSRDGTPFLTPPIIHPDSGEAIQIDELIRHYKGEE